MSYFTLSPRLLKGMWRKYCFCQSFRIRVVGGLLLLMLPEPKKVCFEVLNACLITAHIIDRLQKYISMQELLLCFKG